MGILDRNMIEKMDSDLADYVCRYGVRKDCGDMTFLKKHITDKSRVFYHQDCKQLNKENVHTFVQNMLRRADEHPIVVLENFNAIPDGIDDEWHYIVLQLLNNRWKENKVTVLVLE
jgi:hypothetical protein